jgi:hypothetical protein
MVIFFFYKGISLICFFSKFFEIVKTSLILRRKNCLFKNLILKKNNFLYGFDVLILKINIKKYKKLFMYFRAKIL